MKFVILLSMIFTSLVLNARDPYRTYLLSKTLNHQRLFIVGDSKTIEANSTCIIPRYEIPKGNVFCRLEDKLTRATKVWIKVGVK